MDRGSTPYPGVLTFQHSNRTFRRHLSTEELAKEVQANIEEKWTSEAEWETVVIDSFTLVHKGEQQYRGYLGSFPKWRNRDFGC